jgi:CubicO group peptidase (beta-lactamase class C family)
MTQPTIYKNLEEKLATEIRSYDQRDDTSCVRFALSSPNRNWYWQWLCPGSPAQYFIASATKLYVTAIVMQLRNEGKVELGTPAANFLDPAVMAGIHINKGVDSSEQITVRELISHTSGIGDYFEGKRADGGTHIGDIITQDFSWTFDDVLRITKEQLKPKFAPSARGKAYYSDTNFQILGALIEAVTGSSFEQTLHSRIIEPLGLTGTYPFTLETLDRISEVAPVLYGKQPLVIPKAMASVRSDGGIVSTAKDGIAFLEAFMRGKLFPSEYLDEMQGTWRRIFASFEYGVGIMRFALPRIFSPFRAVPQMIGHSGASGAVLYYVPKADLFISGTVNQLKNRSLPYNLMIRLVFACQDAWEK